MANLARFTINATASSPGGFNATVSQALTFALEGGPSNLVQRWTLQVYDTVEPDAPLASKSAPLLTLVGATSGQKVDAATPGSAITTTMPGSGVHSWLVRSIVNGGIGADGKANPDYVYERFVAIRTGSALRKIIASEGTQYAPGGWADAFNDLIDAGAGPLTAPGGAGDANKVAAASGAGTNLQYAAGVRLANGGNALAFGSAPSGAGILRFPNAAGGNVQMLTYLAWNGSSPPAVILTGDGATFDDIAFGSGDATNGPTTTRLAAKGQCIVNLSGVDEYVFGPNTFDMNGNALAEIGTLDHDGSLAGFYGTAPITKQAGVAVSAAAIHAALVNLGLIAA